MLFRSAAEEKMNYTLLKPKGYPFSELHADMFNQRIRQETYTMKPGDVIFLYTDGLTDVVNEENEMFGEERLYEMIRSRRDQGAQELQDEIYQTLMAFQGNAEQTDDITMITLKRKEDKE